MGGTTSDAALMQRVAYFGDLAALIFEDFVSKCRGLLYEVVSLVKGVMYIYISIYIYLYLYLYPYIYISIYIYPYIYIYIYPYIYISIYIYPYIYISIYIYIYPYIYISIYICIHRPFLYLYLNIYIHTPHIYIDLSTYLFLGIFPKKCLWWYIHIIYLSLLHSTFGIMTCMSNYIYICFKTSMSVHPYLN